MQTLEAAGRELIADAVAAPPRRARGRALRPARQAAHARRARHHAARPRSPILAGVTAVGLALRLAVPRGHLARRGDQHPPGPPELPRPVREPAVRRPPPAAPPHRAVADRARPSATASWRSGSRRSSPARSRSPRSTCSGASSTTAAPASSRPSFGAASPLLIWYSQEARMYAFVELFGLLALWTQLRAIRNPSMGNWAAYILATAALLWSHYFGLLLIGVQQLIWVGVLIHRRAQGEPMPAARARLRLLAGRAGHAADAADRVRPQAVRLDRSAAVGSPSGHLRRPLLLRGGLEHGLGALGLPPRRDHRAARRAAGRCSCCCRCCCSDAAARARRTSSRWPRSPRSCS